MTDALFKTAPKEVIDYFDRRPSVPTFDWRDIATHEHALAYTVAKTEGFNVIEILREAKRRAVVERIPFEQFRDELIPKLKKAGWWGEKRRVDPVTKQPVMAQLGSLRRLQIMYWANVHAAHAAGEWARVERNKEFLPWLTYVASVSERKRPLHMSWVGTTLRVDDAWWRSHYPPNGWNCKCSVRQVGDREAGRLHREFKRDKAPALDEQPWRNKRTGQTDMIPAGIDPGWQTNPGMTRDRTLTRELQGALDRMPEEARARAISKLRTHPVMDYAATGQAQDKFSAVLAELPAPVIKALGSKTGIVRLSGYSARHAMEHPEIKPGILVAAGEALQSGEVFVDGKAAMIFVAIDAEIYRVVVKSTGDGGELFLETMHRVEERHLRKARRRHTKVQMPDGENVMKGGE